MELYSQAISFIGLHEKKLLWSIVACSVLINIYMGLYVWRTSEPHPAYMAPPERMAPREERLNAPYGYRTEVRTVYDGANARTYTDSVPLTEAEILNMRGRMLERDRILHEHFRKQEQLFQDLWNSFPRW
jgi:hypothetical protein